MLLIASHVDDCAVAGKPNDVEWFKKEIKKYFTIKELGQLKKHRGMCTNGERILQDATWRVVWKVLSKV